MSSSVRRTPENVILLEIFPRKQKTRVDFFATEEYLGIKDGLLNRAHKRREKNFFISIMTRRPR
jgi:hypothetical protein